MANKRKGAAFGLTTGERVFEFVNTFILIVIGLMMLLPFLQMASKSFSGETAVLTGNVWFWPVDFQTGTYKYVLRESQFWSSLKVSVIVTVLGTAGAMIITCLTAYPLSKTWLYGRKLFVFLFVFCMLFSGGMVPSYILMKSIGFVNTMKVLIIPGMLGIYNMILLKNFFEEIPEALEESAQLDGAGSLRTLISIVLPMSLPAIATIGLFYAVGYWDNYMTGLIYIQKPEYKPLQLYLYELVVETQHVDNAGNPKTMEALEDAALNTESIRSATIMLTCVPIMCVYPFLQKYFVKGLRVGSVKG